MVAKTAMKPPHTHTEARMYAHTHTHITVVIFVLSPFLHCQFTLCQVLKGNKPDFHQAMRAEESEPMYTDFLGLLGKMYQPEKIKGARQLIA